jgi:hypothetical protein
MTVLGVRCSNRDFAYAILGGSKETPEQVAVRTIPYPKGFAKPQSLHWLAQEVDGLLNRHSVEKIVIKRFEGKHVEGPSRSVLNTRRPSCWLAGLGV